MRERTWAELLSVRVQFRAHVCWCQAAETPITILIDSIRRSSRRHTHVLRNMMLRWLGQLLLLDVAEPLREIPCLLIVWSHILSRRAAVSVCVLLPIVWLTRTRVTVGNARW